MGQVSVSNRSDLVGHSGDFESCDGFTYSILDGDVVIGSVCFHPSTARGHDADVSSWVRVSRAELGAVVYAALSEWLRDVWPFEDPTYALRS